MYLPTVGVGSLHTSVCTDIEFIMDIESTCTYMYILYALSSNYVLKLVTDQTSYDVTTAGVDVNTNTISLLVVG